MDHISWMHAMVLPPEPSSASRAREFVRTHLEDHQRPDLVDDLQLVVSELVTNALLHARTALTVTIEQDGGPVRLTVRDESPVLPHMTVGQTGDTGGRGLVIVDVVSTEWGVDWSPTGAKSVWATFPRAGEGAAAG